MADEEKKVSDTVTTAPVQDQNAVDRKAVISDQNADVTLRFLEEHQHLVEQLTPQK